MEWGGLSLTRDRSLRRTARSTSRARPTCSAHRPASRSWPAPSASIRWLLPEIPWGGSFRDTRLSSGSHPATRRRLRTSDPVRSFPLLLDPHRALQGVHHACELGEQVIPPGIHDAALVFLDERAHRLAVALEGLESPGLILPHEAAVLHGAGAQDRGELALVFFSGQTDSPSAGSRCGDFDCLWLLAGHVSHKILRRSVFPCLFSKFPQFAICAFDDTRTAPRFTAARTTRMSRK